MTRFGMPTAGKMPMLYFVCSGVRPPMSERDCAAAGRSQNPDDLGLRLVIGGLYLAFSVLVTSEKVRQKRAERRVVSFIENSRKGLRLPKSGGFGHDDQGTESTEKSVCRHNFIDRHFLMPRFYC